MDNMEVADDQKLDMDDVINENCPLDKYTLYASEISGDDNIGIINSLQQIFTGEDTLITKTSTMLDDVSPTLSKTKSQRFFSGTTAQDQINNVSAASLNLKKLNNAINNVDVKKIESAIDSYNEHLANLKKNSRMKLLKDAAEKFNDEKNEWKGYPTTKKYTTDGDLSGVGPMYDPDFNHCYSTDIEEYEYEVVSTDSKPEDIKDPNGVFMQTIYHNSITYRIHKYKRVKYWEWVDWLYSPLDPKFDEIEEMFRKVGLELPYDPTKIRGNVDRSGLFATI